MKSEDFIRKYGLRIAVEVVDGRPVGALHFSFEDGDVTYFRGEDYFDNDYSDWFEIYFTIPELVDISELKRVVDPLRVLCRVGIKRAKKVIENNTLSASYYQPSSGCYYRYGHNSLYVVRDGEWKEVYGGMDSSTLVHTDALKQAIRDYELIYGTSND